MARRKKKKTTKNRTNRRSQNNAGQPPRRRRDEKAAIRGMLIGAGVLVFIAILAFVRVGGDTPLNHIIGLFTSDKVESTDDKKKPPTKAKTVSPRSKSTPIKVRPASTGSPKISVKSKAAPKGVAGGLAPKISKNAGKAPPLEKLADGDKAGLDRLIKDKTR